MPLYSNEHLFTLPWEMSIPTSCEGTTSHYPVTSVFTIKYLAAVFSSNSNENIGTGNGTTTEFIGEVTYDYIKPYTFRVDTVIDSTPASVQDDGNGVLSGDGSGSIDYLSGIYTIYWSNPPDDGQNLLASYDYAGSWDEREASTDENGYFTSEPDLESSSYINYLTGFYSLSFTIYLSPSSDVTATYEASEFIFGTTADNLKLPPVTGDSYQSPYGSLKKRLPSLRKVTCTGFVFNNGILSKELPCLIGVAGSGLTGNVGICIEALPALKLTATAFSTDMPGVLDCFVPPFKLRASGLRLSRFYDYVLRYVR